MDDLTISMHRAQAARLWAANARAAAGKVYRDGGSWSSWAAQAATRLASAARDAAAESRRTDPRTRR